MAYPSPFHRIVIAGELYSDIFNMTLAMAPLFSEPIPAATQALADNVGAAVKTWWTRTAGATIPAGPALISSARLTTVKVNRLGTDGRYVDPETIMYTTTPTGGSGSSDFPPAQLATALTLRGADVRGSASKGRIYLPPNADYKFLASDGRYTVAQAKNLATAGASLLVAINAAYISSGVNAVAAIASKSGSGRFQIVTSVTCGRVVDTVRSRRNKLLEAPVETDFDPTP